jgi:ethanolamine utilization protein EutS
VANAIVDLWCITGNLDVPGGNVIARNLRMYIEKERSQMDFQASASKEEKMRIIQEQVPGKQVTLAHIIASPDPVVYKKLGLDPSLDYQRTAIGILSMTPAEIAVIAGDLAVKKADIELGFIDRFSGTLIFTGSVSAVEEAIQSICDYLIESLGFTVCSVTRT